MLQADQSGELTGEISAPQYRGGDRFLDILELNFFLLPISVIIRKECFYNVGLFKSHLPGIDDWDLWTRVAEIYPVAVVEQPVSIYRAPTPVSGQGSSDLGPHLLKAALHQPHLLLLPQAQRLTAKERKEIIRRTRRRIADTLSWNAARRLPDGDFLYAWRNFLIALRLSPLWALRPNHLRQFRLSLLERIGSRTPQRDASRRSREL